METPIIAIFFLFDIMLIFQFATYFISWEAGILSNLIYALLSILLLFVGFIVSVIFGLWFDDLRWRANLYLHKRGLSEFYL